MEKIEQRIYIYELSDNEYCSGGFTALLDREGEDSAI